MKILSTRHRFPAPLQIEEWTRAFVDAVEELGPDTLGFELAGLTSYRPEPAAGSVGVLIPLNGETESLQLGLFAAPDALRALAAAQLGRRDAASLTDADIVGGAMDLVEILVGSIEARLLGREASSRGVPVYLAADGMLCGPSDERAGVQMQVGPVEATLLIVRRRN